MPTATTTHRCGDNDACVTYLRSRGYPIADNQCCACYFGPATTCADGERVRRRRVTYRAPVPMWGTSRLPM